MTAAMRVIPIVTHYSNTMTAAVRIYPIPILTRYGKAHLLGYTDTARQTAAVQFDPDEAAAELRAAHWRGGPCFTCLIAVADILKEAE